MNGRLPEYLAYTSAVLFAYVAFHEISYAVGHPYRYGPAVVIAVVGVAGVLVSLAVAMISRARSSSATDYPPSRGQ